MIKKIKEKIKNILNNFADKNILGTFKKIIELEFKYKILWIITLKISTIFVLINLINIIISIINYTIIYLFKRIKVKFSNKKIKNLTYKRRFKFLKNFYLIIAEKILITFPKQKGFLFFYIVSKSIYEKDKSFIKKEYLPDFLRSLSNRIIIVIVFLVPYIVIYCNTHLVLIIKDLEGYRYETKRAYLDSIILNIYKDCENEYNKLILKLKIKFFKRKIIFNSKRDLIKALLYKKDFIRDFKSNKKFFKFLIVKHEIEQNKTTKEHFTALNKLKNKKILYLNETSKEEFNYYKYNKDINDYIIEKHKNMYIHNGTINQKKIVYYTPNIITEEKKVIIVENRTVEILKNIKEENTNKILMAFSLNLDQNYLENLILKKNGINKNILIENIKLKKTINFYKENKNIIESEQFESVLGMEFFWEENNKYIENLNMKEKIELCNELKIEITSSSKEINFNLFKEVINKK